MEDTAFIEIGFKVLIILFYLIFWGMVFVILYHLNRFGIGVQPKRFSAFFFIGAVILFGVSIAFFVNLDLGIFLK